MIQDALDYVAGGLSLVPLRTDGSKALALPAGHRKTFETRLATADELKQWFPSGNRAAGVLCGVVSGGLEVFDFDHQADTVFPQWCSMVAEIVCWCPVVETPSGGFHVYFRCSEVCGSKKIAVAADNKVIIETRAQGGYVVAPISHQSVHKLNYPYVQDSGPTLPQVPTISTRDRRKLWDAAASFDEKNSRQQLVDRIVQQRQPRRYRRSFKQSASFDLARDWIRSDAPNAISGCGGHDTTMGVATKLIGTYRLSRDQALELMQDYSNLRCDPPWSQKELEHKVNDAIKFVGANGGAAHV